METSKKRMRFKPLVQRVYSLYADERSWKRTLTLSVPRRGWHAGRRVLLLVEDERYGRRSTWISGIDDFQALRLAMKRFSEELSELHSSEGIHVTLYGEEWTLNDEV